MSASSPPAGRGPHAPISRIAGALLMVLLSACAAEGSSSLEVTAPPGGSAATSPTPTMASASPEGSGDASRPVLPTGFPVLPGAEPVSPPADDASIIAVWTLPAEGSGPYDALVAALPAAGFPIVGVYPADRAALIRFAVGEATVWQVLLEHREGGTLVTVQTDRP